MGITVYLEAVNALVVAAVYGTLRLLALVRLWRRGRWSAIDVHALGVLWHHAAMSDDPPAG